MSDRESSRAREREPSSELLSRYLREIAVFPRLTPDEEKSLARRIEKGDIEALRRLVEANLRFVVSYAKRYRNGRVGLLDLINEGNIGLIQAARKFDPSKNVKFITYAVWWIRQAILHALSEQGGAFRLPQKQATLLYRLERARASLGRIFERPATATEVAEETGVPEEEVALLLAAGAENISLSSPVGEDDTVELGDMLEQLTLPATDQAVMQEAFEKQIRDVLDHLGDKERLILELRFGLGTDEPLTLREIGERLSLSRERVRQIESQALEKCRRAFRAKSLHGYLN